MGLAFRGLGGLQRPAFTGFSHLRPGSSLSPHLRKLWFINQNVNLLAYSLGYASMVTGVHVICPHVLSLLRENVLSW